MSDLEKTIDPSVNDSDTTPETNFEENLENGTSTISEDVEKVQDLSEMFNNNASEDLNKNEETQEENISFEDNSTQEESMSFDGMEATQENVTTEEDSSFNEATSQEENNSSEESMSFNTSKAPEENSSIHLDDNNESFSNEAPIEEESIETQPTLDDNFQEEVHEDTPTNVEPEENNNWIILWKFENKMINTTNKENEESAEETPVTPVQQNTDTDAQEKNRLAQKEKLLELIKTHESKSQKEWFIKWIISWIIVGAILLIGIFLLAKDQIFNIFYDTNSMIQNNTVVDEVNNEEEKNNEEDENITSEEEVLTGDIQEIDEEMTSDDYRVKIDKLLASWKGTEEIVDSLNEMLDKILEDEEHDEDLVNFIQQTILDIKFNSKSKEEIDDSATNNNEEATENNEEITSSEETTENNEENTSNEEIPDANEKNYTITHVTTTWEANRVLPNHCEDLDCYWTGKVFIECTNFRLTENLDENSHRIGSNWTCRYKDTSELVHVEFK